VKSQRSLFPHSSLKSGLWRLPLCFGVPFATLCDSFCLGAGWCLVPFWLINCAATKCGILLQLKAGACLSLEL
jgi:hypothetical protein